MKVQVSTIQRTANVQVIELNCNFVANLFSAKFALECALKDTKREKTKFNEDTKEYEKVTDENGNQVYTYNRCDTETLHNEVLPFLQDLANALKNA